MLLSGFYICVVIIIISRVIEYAGYFAADGYGKNRNTADEADTIAIFTNIVLGFMQGLSMLELNLKLKFSAKLSLLFRGEEYASDLEATFESFADSDDDDQYSSFISRCNSDIDLPTTD